MSSGGLRSVAPVGLSTTAVFAGGPVLVVNSFFGLVCGCLLCSFVGLARRQFLDLRIVMCQRHREEKTKRDREIQR